MKMTLAFEYRGLPGLIVSERRALTVDVLGEAMVHWHRALLPAHFTHAAVGRYGYKKRTKAYQIRKARRFHHTAPLRYTGRMEKELLARLGVRTSTSARRSRAVGSLWARVLNLYARPRPGWPDLKAELTASDARDVDALSAFVQIALMRKFRRLRDVKRSAGG